MVFLSFSSKSLSQVFSFNTSNNDMSIEHRILMDDSYFIETQFTKETNNFILTRGGYFKITNDMIQVKLEFNSNFILDSIKILNLIKKDNWRLVSKSKIPLDGKWLMAGRKTDNGENRRDISKPRKTLKVLLDQYFQWIAFNSDTFEFFGSGGGTYNAENGTYSEKIDYFSRDDSKVGLKLEFNFLEKDTDWYHEGFSSKGSPISEIWTKRK